MWLPFCVAFAPVFPKGKRPFPVPENPLSLCLQNESTVFPAPPKGPFRIKNATALSSVVLCYCRGFVLSVAICCFISL